MAGGRRFGSIVLDVIGNLFEGGRAKGIGMPTDVTGAGNFTANGAMTWGVDSPGDIITFEWSIVGKTLTVNFDIRTSTVGGTLNSQLIIAIPGGFTARKNATSWLRYSDNGAAYAYGDCRVASGATTILLLKAAAANWSASTNLTEVAGQIAITVV